MAANALDVSIIALLFLSGLFSMVRGAMKEILSLAVLGGAIVITITSVGIVTYFTEPYIMNSFLNGIISSLIVFLGSFWGLKLIATFLSSHVQSSKYKTLNHALGLVIGVTKSTLIMSAVWLLVVTFVSPYSLPRFIRDSEGRYFLDGGAKLFTIFLPSRIAKPIKKNIEDFQKERKKLKKLQQKYG